MTYADLYQRLREIARQSARIDCQDGPVYLLPTGARTVLDRQLVPAVPFFCTPWHEKVTDGAKCVLINPRKADENHVSVDFHWEL
jgi:hypothetical protein